MAAGGCERRYAVLQGGHERAAPRRDAPSKRRQIEVHRGEVARDVAGGHAARVAEREAAEAGTHGLTVRAYVEHPGVHAGRAEGLHSRSHEAEQARRMRGAEYADGEGRIRQAQRHARLGPPDGGVRNVRAHGQVMHARRPEPAPHRRHPRLDRREDDVRHAPEGPEVGELPRAHQRQARVQQGRGHLVDGQRQPHRGVPLPDGAQGARQIRVPPPAPVAERGVLHHEPVRRGLVDGLGQPLHAVRRCDTEGRPDLDAGERGGRGLGRQDAHARVGRQRAGQARRIVADAVGGGRETGEDEVEVHGFMPRSPSVRGTGRSGGGRGPVRPRSSPRGSGPPRPC